MRKRFLSLILAGGFLVLAAETGWADRYDAVNPADARSVSSRYASSPSDSRSPRRRVRRSRVEPIEDAEIRDRSVRSRKPYRVVASSKSYNSPHVVLEDIGPGVMEGPPAEYSQAPGVSMGPDYVTGPGFTISPDYPMGEFEEGPLMEEPVWTQDWAGCCPTKPVWAHRTGVFGEYLYLRAAEADLIYSIEQTGPDPVNDSPTGPVGRVTTEFESGFRFGFTWALNDCSSIVGSYTLFESSADSFINANGGNVLASQLTHPSVANAGATSIAASASQSIDFQLADLMYRHAFYKTKQSAVNVLGGVRYVKLQQDVTSQQTIGVATGLTTVDTQVSFDGIGLGIGLDGERHHACNGLFVYGKGGLSLVSGEFKADFRQVNQLGGSAVIGNDWTDYRIVSIVDTELGVGWQSRCGNWRLTTGYLVSGWFNTVTSSRYIDAVKAGQYDDVDETLAFNGLTSRLEWRY